MPFDPESDADAAHCWNGGPVLGARLSKMPRSAPQTRPYGEVGDPASAGAPMASPRVEAFQTHKDAAQGMPGERPPASRLTGVAGSLTAHVGSDPVHQGRRGLRLGFSLISCDRAVVPGRGPAIEVMVTVRPNGFIEPCIPTRAAKPPAGPDWVHEIKHDGYRLIVGRGSLGADRSRWLRRGRPSQNEFGAFELRGSLGFLL
jgi:hypothetical protein